MVIDTACLGQGIFLHKREERAMGESRINYLLAALHPQKRVLENSVKADL